MQVNTIMREETESWIREFQSVLKQVEKPPGSSGG